MAGSRAAGRGGAPVREVPLSGWLGDLRYSFRLLGKSPGFTLVAVLTLALGIGANTAIFSVVNGILLRPLPFPGSDRLASLCETHHSVSGFCVASPPNVEDWSRQSRTFAVMGIGRSWPFILKSDEGNQSIDGGIATPGFFRVLEAKAHLGRLLAPEDLETGRNRVAILSSALWRSRFGAEPGILGRAITLDDERYTVIGVLPEGFRVPQHERVELWTPLHFDPRDERRRDWRGFMAIGRLAEGNTLEQAREEMDVIARRLAVQHPETNGEWSVSMTPLHERVVGGARPALLVFLAAVGFVLLIGCANVANLSLARAARRRREYAVRAALGAGRRRLLRLMLAESLLLSLLGGSAGLVLAIWGVDAFVALAPGGIPRLDEVGVDGRVLGFTAGLSVLASFIFGMAPYLHATRLDLNEFLKEGEGRLLERSRLGIRGTLVVTEVSLALVLVVGAGLLARSFLALTRWEPGFPTENLLTVWLLSSSGKYPEGQQVAALYQGAVEEVAALPSILSAGAVSAGPLFGGIERDEFLIEDRPEPPPGERPVARWFDVGPGYFSTLGTPLLRGRDFTDRDVAGAPGVAVINQTMARRHWPGRDPLGERLTVHGRVMTIVGVVADVPPLRPGDPIHSEIYWPQRQAPRLATHLVMRTSTDPSAAIQPVRRRLERVDPDLVISRFATMEQLMDRQLVRPRFNLLLVGIFACVALVLAGVGIYGVIACSVAQRTREIGVRIALGAGKSDILRAVIRQGMAPALIGLLLGLVGALFLTSALGSLLAGVEPTDPLTFAGTALLLALVALSACYIPARRAARIDAMVALRHE